MEDLEEDFGRLASQSVHVLDDKYGWGTHKLIDAKDPTKNPFTLKIHEIILCLLICGPSGGALERLECGETVSKFYALFFERNDRFRGIGASGGRRDFTKEGGEDGGGIERHPHGRRCVRLDHQ